MVEKIRGASTIKLVKIQSLIEAHLVYNGKASRRHYEWKRAGEIISVLEEDVPELLEKRLGGKQCCGDQGGNKIFQLGGG